MAETSIMYIFKRILIGILVLLSGLLIIFLIYTAAEAIYHQILRYETFPSTAEVCDKVYEDSYTTTTMIQVSKSIIPQS